MSRDSILFRSTVGAVVACVTLLVAVGMQIINCYHNLILSMEGQKCESEDHWHEGPHACGKDHRCHHQCSGVNCSEPCSLGPKGSHDRYKVDVCFSLVLNL